MSHVQKQQKDPKISDSPESKEGNVVPTWGKEFYIHGSVHRESNLIVVQQDAKYSVHHISVGSSTCFGC